MIGLLPVTMAAGQEKKSEQKVKIVVADDSGTKVILDTLLNDAQMDDNITLRDGKVIFIGEGDKNTGLLSDKGPGHYVVTVSEDGNGSKTRTKEITVVSSDPATWISEKGDEKSYTYSITTDNSQDKKSDYERTKYVITKNGMVVTIEGEDYAKVKRLADEISGRIDGGKVTEENTKVRKK